MSHQRRDEIYREVGRSPTTRVELMPTRWEEQSAFNRSNLPEENHMARMAVKSANRALYCNLTALCEIPIRRR